MEQSRRLNKCGNCKWHIKISKTDRVGRCEYMEMGLLPWVGYFKYEDSEDLLPRIKIYIRKSGICNQYKSIKNETTD